LHDVRQIYATLARDLGVDSKIVTDRLGHANETVTQQIYTHRSTGNDRPAAEMIARLVAGALGTGEAD
jgi:integrase